MVKIESLWVPLIELFQGFRVSEKRVSEGDSSSRTKFLKLLNDDDHGNPLACFVIKKEWNRVSMQDETKNYLF